MEILLIVSFGTIAIISLVSLIYKRVRRNMLVDKLAAIVMQAVYDDKAIPTADVSRIANTVADKIVNHDFKE